MQIIDGRLLDPPLAGGWGSLLARPVLDTHSLEATVSAILQEVQEQGTRRRYADPARFDHVLLGELEVSLPEAKAARMGVAELKQAIELAKRHIELFHQAQVHTEQRVETSPGVSCWRRSCSHRKSGAIHTRWRSTSIFDITDVGSACSYRRLPRSGALFPPDRQGRLHPAILYAASLVGIRKIFKVGGVQAIGAMAFGTASIPRVDKIFGPGNQYVTCAKKIVQRQGLAIDMPAGPSELAIYADKTANPIFVAADLLSQAEHGPDSQVVLLSDSRAFLDQVIPELEHQLLLLPRQDIAKKACGIPNSFLWLMPDKPWPY